MCPDLQVEGSLLPDSSIANRVIMFTVLQTMQAEQRRTEDVDLQLRDRYEVFRQVLPNYPMPEQTDRDVLAYVTGDEQQLRVSVLVQPTEASRDADASNASVTTTVSF
ncbi:hypothetical protein KR018_001899, partial [Drosophila ironensis]